MVVSLTIFYLAGGILREVVDAARSIAQLQSDQAEQEMEREGLEEEHREDLREMEGQQKPHTPPSFA